jgi:hypothetical protein
MTYFELPSKDKKKLVRKVGKTAQKDQKKVGD